MINPVYLKALRLFFNRLKSSTVIWAVTGSMSMALQGVPVVPKDIDIQTDEKGVYIIEKLFKEYIVKPVSFSGTDIIRSHFGCIELFNIPIEIMGGIQKRLPSGIWEPPIDIKPHCRFVKLESMNIPVLSLDYEEQAYRKLGRDKKADLLKKYLQNTNSEVNFSRTD